MPEDTYPKGLLVTLSDTTVSTCLAVYVVTVELAPSVGWVPTASSLFVSVAVPIVVPEPLILISPVPVPS